MKGLELLTCHEVYLHKVVWRPNQDHSQLDQLADIDNAATNVLRDVDNADAGVTLRSQCQSFCLARFGLHNLVTFMILGSTASHLGLSAGGMIVGTQDKCLLH